jgi:excinuclease ABC subunit C
MLYQNLPKSPGVYLFKDKKQNVLYVGKAINIKNRVKNHFTDKNDELRHQNLLNLVEKIDFQVVSSEMEALLLETRLIKIYKPKFNVRLKDDKRYLYVGISKEIYPRIYLLRKPEIEKNLADWFGPFPTAQSLKEILRLLRRVFPYRSCPKLPKSLRPCLYYHLRLCPAPCINQVENYSQNIKKIRLFLNGQIKPLLNLLTKQMKQSAEELKFEEAQIYKKQIESIQYLLGKRPKSAEEEKTQKQLEQLKDLLIRYQGFDPFIIHRIEAYDVSNLGKEITVGSMVAFIEGEPASDQYRQFKIIGIFQNDVEALKQIIKRRLAHREWIFPQVILVDGGKGQVSAAFGVLKEKNLAGKIGLLGLAKELETIIVPKILGNKIAGWKSLNLSANSPVLQLLQAIRDESHRFAQRYYKKVYKKKAFKT